MQTLWLRNQKALVTGASSGIGAATALALAAAGAAVVVNHIDDADNAHRIVEDISQQGGEAFAVEADVADENQVKTMFTKMCQSFGTIDILVNNAGIQRDAPFIEMTLGDWSKTLSVDLTGSFLCAREAAKEFLRRGVVTSVSKSAGKIIFMSSVHEIIPWTGRANYAAAKGGMHMLMASIAQELAPHKIRVNAIAPGAIKTDINRDAWEDPESRKELLKLIPYGRVGEVEDVSRTVVWLASDEAEYVTGASIPVDGGMLLYPGFRHGG